MFSDDVRTVVPRNSLSHVSTASQRSSSGVRFQRWQTRHTTQSRPFAGSNASRRPTGNSSTTSFAPSDVLQNMQVWYMADFHRPSDTSRITRTLGTSISSRSM